MTPALMLHDHDTGMLRAVAGTWSHCSDRPKPTFHATVDGLPALALTLVPGSYGAELMRDLQVSGFLHERVCLRLSKFFRLLREKTIRSCSSLRAKDHHCHYVRYCVLTALG